MPTVTPLRRSLAALVGALALCSIGASAAQPAGDGGPPRSRRSRSSAATRARHCGGCRPASTFCGFSATLTPVPEGLTWDPRNAERVLERADAVIGPMRIRAPTYNPIKIFRALRAARRLSRNPEGSTLADVAAAGSLRPLRRAAPAPHARRQTQRGAAPCARGAAPARRRARRRRAHDGHRGHEDDRAAHEALRRRGSARRTSRPKPRPCSTELEKVTREAELNCFATVLTTLETDLDGMKERAQAWAIGDVDALRRFDYPDAQGDCLEMLFSSAGSRTSATSCSRNG